MIVVVDSYFLRLQASFLVHSASSSYVTVHFKWNKKDPSPPHNKLTFSQHGNSMCKESYQMDITSYIAVCTVHCKTSS